MEVAIKHFFDKGDIASAQKVQARSRRTLSAIARGRSFLPSGKALMAMVGVDCGPTRPPIVGLTDAEKKAMKADMDETGFFKYAGKRVDDFKTLT